MKDLSLPQPQSRTRRPYRQKLSLLERLSPSRIPRTASLPSEMCQSEESMLSLNPSELEQSENLRLPTKSDKSLATMMLRRTNPLSSRSSINMPLPLTKSKPSLQSQIDMGNELVEPQYPWENAAETMMEEVRDMQNLTGIIPKSPPGMIWTRSWDGCQERRDSKMDTEVPMGRMILEERVMPRPPVQELEGQTRNSVCTNPRCPGLTPSNKSETPPLKPVVIRPEISSTYSNKIQQPSNVGSEVLPVHHQDSLLPSGMPFIVSRS